VRSSTHSTRRGGAGNLMAAWHREDPIAQPLPLPEGGGHRNAAPLYNIPNARILYDFIPAMPLRVSALRSLGAYMNIFSIESFMDELAQARAADPVEFRLQHLDDPVARRCLDRCQFPTSLHRRALPLCTGVPSQTCFTSTPPG
jgi:nicotinate dehydrogenase subunit B